MISRLAADLVVLVHLAFILFVVFGGWVVLRHRKLMLLHLPAVAWGAWIEFTGGVCPLTPLENRLRISSGLAGYAGGFIEEYLLPVVYPAGLTRPIQIALGVAVVLVNLIFYGLLVKRRARGTGDAREAAADTSCRFRCRPSAGWPAAKGEPWMK